jgi:hypothetical protein
LIISLAIPGVRAQPAGTINVPSSVTIAAVGQTTTVEINVSSVQNYYGISSLFLYWSNTVLSCESVTTSGPGSIDGSLHLVQGVNVSLNTVINNSYNATNGLLEFSDAYLLAGMKHKPGSFNGSGTLAWITFNGTAAGVSPLTIYPNSPETAWTIIHYGSTSTFSISAFAVVGNGEVTVVPEFSVVAAVSLLLVGTVAAILVGKTVRSKKRKSVSSTE